MRITYLDHSGFAVETRPDRLLVFDEYNPKAAAGGAGVVTAEQVRAHAHSALLLSHSHEDHWCREAVALPFGRTLLGGEFPGEVPGVRMQPGDEFSGDGMRVRAFGSTDEGVSFLVDADGARIFHAGDLNLWHWEEESTAQEVAEATEWFERELAKLLPYAGTLDVAFFPLDPRMGGNTARGADRFLAAMRPRVFIPMHCQGDAALAQRYAADRPQVRAMVARGQQLDL